ncbi:MAG: GNAT family N-acetyltransferase [Deltaproteobacteria bacterium]
MNEIIVKTGVEIDGKNGFFYLEHNNDRAGKMTFYFSDEKTMVIDHAGVDDIYNGLGYGKRLVAEAVTYARENQIKIVPICPFVKKVMERNPEYMEVLAI